MEFRKLAKSKDWECKTPKGKIILFPHFNDEKLVFSNKKESIKTNNPTKLSFFCDFPFTSPMLDELESSQVIEVKETQENRKQVDFYPLPFFTLEKLQDILFDLSKKFEL